MNINIFACLFILYVLVVVVVVKLCILENDVKKAFGIILKEIEKQEKEIK